MDETPPTLPPSQTAADLPEVKNYLVQSILVTLLCCLPLGIPAIIFASQVNSKLAMGDLEGAQAASRKAKMWSWWSFGAGLTATILYIILMVVGAAGAGAEAYGY